MVKDAGKYFEKASLQYDQKQVESHVSIINLIESFLSKANERQQTKEAVKKWLNQLRDFAHYANEVLDSFAYKVQHQKLICFAAVRNSLSRFGPKSSSFRHETATIVKDVKQTLGFKAMPFNSDSKFCIIVGGQETVHWRDFKKHHELTDGSLERHGRHEKRHGRQRR